MNNGAPHPAMNAMQSQQAYYIQQQQQAQQQSQQQLSQQSYQVASPMIQQGLISHNSPVLQSQPTPQQSARSLGVSPQLIHAQQSQHQRGTPSPSAALMMAQAGGTAATRLTPPNNNANNNIMALPQQQSPLAGQGGGLSSRSQPPQYVQYTTRPNSAAGPASGYPAPGTPQQQQTMMAQQQTPGTQQQQQMAMYRQQQQNSQQQQQNQGQQIRYAYIQNNDGSVQHQTIAGNGRLQVVAQQMQGPSRYGSPHQPPQQQQQQQHLQQQQQQHLQQQQQQHLQQQQQQHLQQQQPQQQIPQQQYGNGVHQVVVSSPMSQQQQHHQQQQQAGQLQYSHQQQQPQRYIVLPSGQQAQIVPAGAVIGTVQGGAPTGAGSHDVSYQVYQPMPGATQAIVVADGAPAGKFVDSPPQAQYVAVPPQQPQQQQTTLQSQQQQQQLNQPLAPPKSKSPNKPANSKIAKGASATTWKKAPTPGVSLADSGHFDGVNYGVPDGNPYATAHTGTFVDGKISPTQLAEAASHTTLISRINIDAMLKSLDDTAVLEDDAASSISQVLNEFVGDAIAAGVAVSRHRNATCGTNGAPTFQARDLRYALRQSFGIVPASSSSGGAAAQASGSGNNATTTGESGVPPQLRATTAHEQRLALIQRTLMKH